ncbi:MAG: hypothetical protein CMF49_07070 [Legionellales bacterium]|nr:hypothetical protein [Legionellales bacterium]|tara:strand:+ start:2081 stop:2944 length:864 start_codon:yes stop_codon:yes gene_type:complete
MKPTVYLDTCHLQLVATSSEVEYKQMKKILQDKKLTLVYSWINFSELIARKDENKVCEIADFLSSVEIKYLKDNIQLFKLECSSTKEQYFSDNLADAFVSYKDVETYVRLADYPIGELIKYTYKEQNNTKEEVNKRIIQSWGDTNAKIAEGIPKDQYWKTVKSRFTGRARIFYYKHLDYSKTSSSTGYKKIGDEKIIEAINIEPENVLSYAIPFYTQYQKHRQKLAWQKNSLWDIEHCTAVPFVDYFITDKGNHSDLAEAMKQLKYNRTRVYSSLNMLLDDLKEKLP